MTTTGKMFDSRTITIIALVLFLILAGAYFLNEKDNRGFGERLDDAAEVLPNGIGDAADQLKDRTPLEKLDDKAESIKRDIQKN